MKLIGHSKGQPQILGDLTPQWWKARTEALPNGCLAWKRGKFQFGHGAVKVDGKTKKAHRVAWEQAHGTPVPEGLFLCHRCDNPSCVNVEHLFLGTLTDNNNDRDAKGRAAHQHGEAHGMCRLTDSEVDEIRKLKTVLPIKRIAALYGISRGHASDLINGRKRAHKTQGAAA